MKLDLQTLEALALDAFKITTGPEAQDANRLKKVRAMAFDKQATFIDDPRRLKAIWCTRRAAKSFTDGLYAFHEALKHPRSNILYVGLTRAEAKGIIWKDVLEVINRDCDIQAAPNLTELYWKLPNGSEIHLTGIDADEAEMNKKLGRKYRLVIVDEASMYKVDLKRFVYDIIGPATADERGVIVMSGTSSNLPRGLFYDVTTGKEPGWSLHTWTAYDNPHMAAQWAEIIHSIKTERPLYAETKQYKQWYENQWVVDEDALVYRFRPDRNLFTTLPRAPQDAGWTWVLGVDLGHSPDPSAFVICCYHEHIRCLYILESYEKLGMDVTDVANQIKQFQGIYPISTVVIDGSNKQAVEEMRRRHAIHLIPADKKEKSDFIELMNAELIQGAIKLHAVGCSALSPRMEGVPLSERRGLIEEMQSLLWESKAGKITYPRKEKDGLPNHACDAALYAWRHSYQYQSEAAPPKEVVGSREWYLKQSENMWDREREAIEKQEGHPNTPLWPSDGGWPSSGY
jgi:hypothetical protein